jgi:hypothetical protein
MKESVTYRAMLEEGKAWAREQAEARGMMVGMKQALFRLGLKRFGPPDLAIIAAIEGIADREHVEALIERVLDISGWDELLTPPGPA